MTKRKDTLPAVELERHIKRPRLLKDNPAFVWKRRDWTERCKITEEVSILVNKSNPKQLVVKKVLLIKSNSANDMRPHEVRALSMLPNCNRIVKPLLYSHADPDPEHGTVIFKHFPLGDLVQWKEREFEAKNMKPVPESFIWRFFLQMSQALAFLQKRFGPDRDQRHIMLHRDIKLKNILVVGNGTTYPSFMLHDFDCALIYQKAKARLPAFCGTYEWQPPENPIVNTTAADIWALGAIVHFLATGDARLQSRIQYAATRVKENNRDPESATAYTSVDRYYAARVPRRVTLINLTEEEQRQQGITPDTVSGRACYNHQYSDEVNDWMQKCLSTAPHRRPTAERLVNDMGLVVRNMLKCMGRTAALADMDVKFGLDG